MLLKISKLLFLALFLFSSKVLAECDFKTGKYTENKLGPKNINEIKITIPKSGSYAKNIIESSIYGDTYGIIPKHLKKKFRAQIKVSYPFGDCNFRGKIWQNGDWTDHLSWNNGKPIRSLNVKLENGNIANAIKFKLFLPKTREYRNEILGSIIANNFGFISPETFEVSVSVNNVNSIMIFQEDSQKELLERNNRREGPIFEGDESLLWGYENRENLYLEKISLARMINANWFLKGSNSRFISLQSFSRLQNSYLDYVNSNLLYANKHFIKPNKNNLKIFQDFSFLMFIMGGDHALRPHNRKFYFNSFINDFEPIYYDGNIMFSSVKDKPLNAYNFHFKENYTFDLLGNFKDLSFKKKIILEYKKRLVNMDKLSNKKLIYNYNNERSNKNYKNDDAFVLSKLETMEKNAIIIQNLIDEKKLKFQEDFIIDNSREKYLDLVKELKINQDTIKTINFTNNEVNTKFYSGEKKKYNIRDFSKIIKRNAIKDKRLLLLISKDNNPWINIENPINHSLKNIKGKFESSRGISIKVNQKEKNIFIQQSKPDDWILIKDANLKNWNLYFNGIKANLNNKLSNQRFNKYGLTGCMNIYNSKIRNSSIQIKDSQCEDSLNIINSKGKFKDIKIFDAYQDALDMDFSEISIDNIEVKNAGNDCLDLSGGKYFISESKLKNCKDKAFSVGEKTNLIADNLFVQSSEIGISVKDLSSINLSKGIIKNTKICLEAFQKKQEFGGGNVQIFNLECKSDILNDKNSIIKIY